MRVAVAGVGSVLGRCAVPGLGLAGHEIVDVGQPVRSPADVDRVSRALEGVDAVVNLAAQIPVGPGSGHRRAWRTHDLIRAEGTRRLVAAARAAGVRRFVQQSVSYVYADQGQEWVVEGSPLCVTTATEPASVGEMAVQDFSAVCRVGVVLRMGLVIGASPLTQWAMRAAAHGRAIGLGSPEGFIHLLHSDDVASALHAALDAPSGVYNVGATPVLRRVFVDGCAAAVGRPHGAFLGPVSARLRGNRLEPLGRSLRVSSAHFTEVTGWTPHRDRFDVSWFDAAAAGHAVLR